jgi:hypothetical protein
MLFRRPRVPPTLYSLAARSLTATWRRNRPSRSSQLAPFYLLISILVSSCVSDHLRVPANGPPPNAARYVELLSEKQVATLHFPAGIYSFYAVDNKGFYYRSPRPVIQHTAAGSMSYHGGIFVSGRDPKKLRGYIFFAGGLTHVGDLSATPHVLGE